MKSSPISARPVIEIATVTPAKITARPAVAPAAAAASCGRQAVVQELPEPRDDEQRVVDPDAQADHRHQDLGDRVEVRQPGCEEEQQEAHPSTATIAKRSGMTVGTSARNSTIRITKAAMQPDQVAAALRRRGVLRLARELAPAGRPDRRSRCS